MSISSISNILFNGSLSVWDPAKTLEKRKDDEEERKALHKRLAS
jgi:hypothetical protein